MLPAHSPRRHRRARPKKIGRAATKPRVRSGWIAVIRIDGADDAAGHLQDLAVSPLADPIRRL